MRPLRNRQIIEDVTEQNHYSSALPEAAVFLLITLVILLFGLAVLYSTSFGIAGMSYFKKQLLWTAVGLGGFTTALLIGYKKLSDWSPWMMIGIFLALAAALCFEPVNGARRWIRIGAYSVQPSEYAKLVLVFFLAKFLSDRTRLIESHPFRVFWQSGLCCGIIILMVMAGHDLGTSVLLGLVFLAMLFVAGVRLLYILPWVAICPPALFFLVREFSPVRYSRITTFLNPELTQSGEGYQLWLSFLALGSGSWLGIGFTESRLKQKYLPEAHTDFILSIVGEELGFICLCLVIAAYLVFIITAYMISCKARTRQGMLLVFGILAFIGFQALINIGVISGAFPTKGMPAPFISYGGSNLVSCLTAAGVVFSVALDNAFPDYQDLFYARMKERLHHLRTMIYSGKTP